MNATEPVVSVIVPVHNAMPYLAPCLASLIEQSIGRDRLEVIAVDDGSADGSGNFLDLLARTWDGLRVVHLEHCGGPSRARNRGLDLAAGRFVYFLDADDYLAAEALERMIALAEQDGAEIVACPRQHISGRKLHIPSLPKARHSGVDVESFDTFNSEFVLEHWNLLLMVSSDCKHLILRERIEGMKLRFTEGVHFGEDSIFAETLAKDARLAMVAGYICYYERFKADGTNLTSIHLGSEMHLDALERAWQLRDAHEPAWRHSQLCRDAVLDLTRLVIGDRFAQREVSERRRLVDRSQALLARWMLPGMAARLPALDRLKTELISRGAEPELTELTRVLAQGRCGKDLVENGRVYGGFPFFRDADLGLDDECYDVTRELALCHYLAGSSWAGSKLRLTGHAYIEHIDTAAQATELVLRNRLSGGEYRWPATTVLVSGLAEESGQASYDYGQAGFDVEIDFCAADGVDPLPAGQWGAHIAVTARGIAKEAPLGGSRAPAITEQAGGSATAAVSVRFTKFGALRFDVAAEPA